MIFSKINHHKTSHVKSQSTTGDVLIAPTITNHIHKTGNSVLIQNNKTIYQIVARLKAGRIGEQC